MKTSLLKIAAITLFAAAIAGAPALSRAADKATPEKKDKAAGEKFYGPVTAVDTNAMTFTVGEQTFLVTSKSVLTKNDKPATIADAVTGEVARGSYTKSADGKLEVAKVRFGKKSAAGKAGGKSGGKKKKGAESANQTAPATPPANEN